jgi:hypothetical protein
MADSSTFRSYRSHDPNGRGEPAPAADTRQSNDPLAELARLIGQNDPFVDLRLNEAARASRQPHAASAPQRSAYGVQQAAQPSNNQTGDQYADVHGSGAGFQPAYDPAIYGSAATAEGHETQTYYENPAPMPHGDEGYDDTPETPRRSRFGLVAILIGLTVLGGGGALAYRTFYGAGGTATSPPVIKADTAPTKVPGQSGEPTKLIYDRVGEVSQGEKVVSREEQPIDIKDAQRSAPRVVFPGLPNAADRPDSATISSTLAAAPSVGPASSEPKKVKTVTIRPDQPLAIGPSAVRPSASPATRNATATSPSAGAPSAPSAPPANQRVAAKPPTAPGPAQPAGSAPLSLNPQGTSNAAIPSAPPPARAVAAPATPARVASASSGGEAGSYTVQLSSQRSEPEAQASFRALQSKFPNLLSDRQPIIRRADLGDKGIYFRTMVGPFTSIDQAREFCGSLKSAGGQCVVPIN